MGLFSGEKISEIRDEAELFTALTKRKYWKEIDRRIIRRIFENANGDIDKIQRFRFVSELHHCVEANFIAIAKEEVHIRNALALFAVTLERLAAQASQEIPKLPDGSREQGMVIGTAELAYMSSILCNPFILPSYSSLATLYLQFDLPDKAAAVCQEYDVAEQQLLGAYDGDLSFFDQGMKQGVSEERRTMDEIKRKLGL